MILTSTWLGISNGIKVICSEKYVYWRERLWGLKLHNYILSKLAILVPISIFQVLIMGGAIWLFMSPPASAISIFLILFFCSLAGLALGLLVSSIAKTTEQAVIFLPILLIPQILLSKAVTSLKQLGEFWTDVLSGLTITRWGMEAMNDVINLRKFMISSSDYSVSFSHSILALGLFIIIFFLGTFFVLRSKDGKRIV